MSSQKALEGTIAAHCAALRAQSDAGASAFAIGLVNDTIECVAAAVAQLPDATPPGEGGPEAGHDHAMVSRQVIMNAIRAMKIGSV